jgi:ubiquinone/menaquinone biosynthesis C-methylase UbiE
MEARLQRRVQRYGWDKAALSYEQSWHRQLAPAQTRLLTLAALRPGERVIDVACGTGLVTFAAAAAVGPEGTVLGTDISDAMVAQARARATGIPHDLRFERMDAEELALPNATFDVALCALGLMYVPDVARALSEMTRVVVPGGRVVAAVWGQRSPKPAAPPSSAGRSRSPIRASTTRRGTPSTPNISGRSSHGAAGPDTWCQANS